MAGDKISTFSERFRQLIEESGKNQTVIAEEFGMSKQALSTWVNGTASPKKPTLLTIAAHFGVNVAWLMGFDVPRNITTAAAPARRNIIETRPYTVPMLGNVAAGQPIYAPEDYEARVPVTNGIKCDFAMCVKGDSMTPYLHDGDVIFVREQPDVDDGRIAVVFIGDEALIKHVYKTQNGLTLVSDNPDYPPIYVDPDDCETTRIAGKPVAYLRGM